MAEKISKMEAVRRALAELGDAKPARMQGWIKERFGIQMTTGHISTYKGDIRRKAGRGKKAPARKPAAGSRPEAQQAPPRPAASSADAIPLDDILYTKALVERHGVRPLHTLIDAFGK